MVLSPLAPIGGGRVAGHAVVPRLPPVTARNSRAPLDAPAFERRQHPMPVVRPYALPAAFSFHRALMNQRAFLFAVAVTGLIVLVGIVAQYYAPALATRVFLLF